MKFSANKAVFGVGTTTSTTGALLANFPDAIKDFNYSVTVIKGEDSFTSATTGKVTVVDATATKTITEVELQNSDEDAVTSNTVTLDDSTFKVVPTKGTNVKGEEITEFSGVVTYKSSNNAVALVGANGEITPVSAGTTTITVTSGEGSKTITLTVSEATRTITTVKADVTSVDVVEGADKVVNISALDQLGDAIATGELTVSSAKEAIASVAKDGSEVTISGVAKGSTTVTVKAGTKTISIPVTVGENKKASYKLELVTVANQSTDSTIDVAKVKDNKVTVAYNAYNATNQLVGAAAISEYNADEIGEGFTYEVIEKSTAGATAVAGTIVEAVEEAGKITLTAKKAGTVTVNIYDGALKVATQTITVNDSTPTVTGATFVKDAKVTKAGEEGATSVLKVSGLTFTSTASDATLVYADSEGTITNGESVQYGSFDLLDNLSGGTVAASVVEGELVLTVTQTGDAEVTGTVSVRVKDNSGKIVSVGTIDVEIAAAPAEDEEV